MRSLLLVPADGDAGLDLAATAGADAVVVDLGQPAEAQARPQFRRRAAGLLRANRGATRVFVRIAPLSSGLAAADLDAILPARPDGICLAGAVGGADIGRLSAMLRPREAEAGLADGAITIIAAAADTPAGLFALASCGGASARLVALAWSAADLAAATGAAASRDPTGNLADLPRLARSLTLAAAAAAGVAAIDSVFEDTEDLAGLAREAEAARRDGFSAKIAIAAAQVAVINRVFTPKVASSR